MTAPRPLNDAELRFINLVAARRFGAAAAAEPPPLQVTEGSTSANPFRRAASVAAALLAGGAPSTATRPRALLAMCCQLQLDGYELLAPQGTAAGMIAALAKDHSSGDALSRWLEDRSVAVDPA